MCYGLSDLSDGLMSVCLMVWWFVCLCAYYGFSTVAMIVCVIICLLVCVMVCLSVNVI